MEPNRPDLVPIPSVRRLSLYLRELESCLKREIHTISSRQLGESLGVTDTQVRKDLAYFGPFGHPGVGYIVQELINQLRHILGTDKTSNVLLVGAGNLGRALLAYKGFAARGFELRAVFDNDPAKIGRRFDEFTVQPLDELAATAGRLKIRLAILAVPAEVAQETASRLINAGICGLLNFAPLALAHPDHIAIDSVDLAVQLEQLSFQVNVSTAANLKKAGDQQG